MTVPLLRLGQESCSRPQSSLRLEWLETNGIGGFASSTVSGIHTRRYHGFLTAALQPPVGRHVLLSKFEEALIVDGQRFEFSSNEYPGVIHPNGASLLCEFRLDPFPIFVFQIAGLELEKRVFMIHGQNATVVEYELRALDREPLPACVLELRPLLAFRDYHSTLRRNDALDRAYRAYPGGITVQPYPSLPALHLSHTPAQARPTGDWFYNLEFAIERERGLDFQEDLFNPCTLSFDLSQRPQAAIIAATCRLDAERAPQFRDREIARRAQIGAAVPQADAFTATLLQAADQFIVKRGQGSTIIAGYPWFSDWGRDTMIALPGLTLATSRFEVARNILSTFAASVDSGMLPNRFPDSGETAEYNTVDATLWYFEAVRAYLASTGDYAFVRERIYPVLKEILHWHLCGTRYGIRCEADGLLACGEPGVQLTWMDAKIGDWVVTPRVGKPVEVQALWYNALCVVEDLAALFGDADIESLCQSIHRNAKESFNRLFWNSAAQCLYDCVNGEERDGSIRPNQIFAVSLYFSMLDRERATQVVDRVRRDLLTPMGLRTLCSHDPRYRGVYSGGVEERDSAYHQGTVWPWLLGPFLTAFLKVNDRSARAQQEARLMLAGLEAHLAAGGLAQLSEIADGNYPHTPRGCFAQAWSVAEILRVCVEDLSVREAHASPTPPGISAAPLRISSAA
jgi:predicted glycogen debranching enzyme